MADPYTPPAPLTDERRQEHERHRKEAAQARQFFRGGPSPDPQTWDQALSLVRLMAIHTENRRRGR